MTYDTDHWTDNVATPVFTTRIDADNTFVMLSRATGMMRQLGVPRDRIERLRQDVLGAVSYDQVIELIEAWFPVDRA